MRTSSRFRGRNAVELILAEDESERLSAASCDRQESANMKWTKGEEGIRGMVR